MNFVFLDRESDASLTPDEVRNEHKKALADFTEARRATLTVNLAGMVPCGNEPHHVGLNVLTPALFAARRRSSSRVAIGALLRRASSRYDAS